MKSLRVTLAVLALLALPFVAANAQGNSADNKCKNVATARSQGTASAAGLATAPGQLKKCPPDEPPPPSDEPPPTGPHSIYVLVYEDVDGDGSWNMFAGELGLAAWNLQLYWNGRVVAEMATDGNGVYEFQNLGNATYSVCVVPQAGYLQTQPAPGNACAGAGYEVALSGAFGTRFDRFFGFMLQ